MRTKNPRKGGDLERLSSFKEVPRQTRMIIAREREGLILVKGHLISHLLAATKVTGVMGGCVILGSMHSFLFRMIYILLTDIERLDNNSKFERDSPRPVVTSRESVCVVLGSWMNQTGSPHTQRRSRTNPG